MILLKEGDFGIIPLMNLREIGFCLRHPVQAAAAKRRQIAASVEIAAPPHTATWEEFPEMSIGEAARAMQEARPTEERGDVPLSAWSKEDQERMKRGELPKGYPDHPNI